MVRLLLACLCSFTLLTCGGPDTEEATASVGDQPFIVSTEPIPPALVAGDTLEAWVDGLFIRARAERDAQILVQVSQGTPLAYTGEASAEEETIVLRGIAFTEPWLRVRTTDGQQGWVFGGAVQRRGQAKGTGQRSENEVDFPRFGRFDLNEWRKLSEEETSGGDAVSIIRVYEKGDRQLTVRRTETGEYGYEHDYTLSDTSGHTLKTRNLRFQTDPDLVLVEIVTDLTTDPPLQHRRTQAMTKHFLQLNARPEMASGPWETRKPVNQ
ncbi:SH3 domain-containing protein [Lewinella sp. JB7]|uniref:SH3 domain-containing protein n=1 Tax=Lewinella sp. JB7 TaxID=2962887 RepID=UPI0020C947E3|nr:SH3 domain-containing protein [Lewinella sp. JB7]MCP9237633.1 SH3 domain-containing protein [Lewinella sp. JB7]